MKLHLPKVLFTAVVAAVCCVPQAMAETYYLDAGTTHDALINTSFRDGEGVAIGYTTFTNASSRHDLIINKARPEGNVVKVDFLPIYFSSITIAEGATGNYFKRYDANAGSFFIGDPTKATTSTFKEDFTIELTNKPLQLDGTQTWNIDAGNTVTLKAPTIKVTGDITFAGGSVEISSAITNEGTVQTSGTGKIVVEDYVTFNGTKTYSYSDTATGNGYATATITVIDGGSIGKEGSSVAVEVNGQSYTTTNGKVTHTDNSNYWVNTSEVTAGTGEGEIDAARYVINGGKLNLNSGNWTSAKVIAEGNDDDGSINLGTNATFTGSVNNAVDAGVMQYITGTGTMEVTVGDDWNNVIKAHSGFTGTTYVKAGATTNQGQPIGKFTYNATDTVIGSILKMGEGVHMQVNNTVNNTESNKAGYTPDAIDATLAADKQIILEAGGHDVYVNGHVIFDVYGTISGEGTFNKHAGGVINFKNGSKVANLESSSTTNATGITNIEAGASVTNFAVKGSTSNIHGGANVENVSVAGGTLNLGVDAGAELSVSSLSYTNGTVNNNVATAVNNLAVTAGKTFTVGGTGVLTATTLELKNGAKLTSSTGSITLGTLSIDLAAYTTDYTNTHTLVSVTGENQNLTVTGSLANVQGVSVADGAYVADVQLQDNSLVLTYYSTLLTTTVSDVSGYDAEKNILTLCVSGDINNFHSTALVTGFDGDVLDKIFTEAGLTAGQMVGITLIDAEGDELPASADKLVGFQGPDGVYQGELVGSQWQYNVSYIPEPATATLSLLALAGLAARRRRK